MVLHSELKSSWLKLKEDFPKLRIKDAAEQLNFAEMELTQCVEGVIRLKENFQDQFLEIENLGLVMALTRNESIVHECKGKYQNISFNKHVGLVLGSTIDLRIFPKKISHAFFVPVQQANNKFLSIQFFDAYGVAVHKIYLLNSNNRSIHQAFVKKFMHRKKIQLFPIKEKNKDVLTEKIDTQTFLDDWANLQDTHDFYPLLVKNKINRFSALKIAEGAFTEKVSNSTTEKLLQNAVNEEVEIMIFVSSGAVIQIYSGNIYNVKKSGHWLNVLDPEFNLHLRDDHIVNTWIVKKPTADGIVTSLEIFDNKNKNIATFFGSRKPGIPESLEWRNILASSKKRSL